MALKSSELANTLSAIDASTYENDTERAKAASALLAALRRLQTPWEVAFEMGWAQPSLLTAVKTLKEAGLWSKWVAAGGQTATVSELSTLTNIDPELLRRFLRCIAGESYLTEVDVETYALTPFTRSMGDEKFASIYNYIYHTNLPVFQNFHKFAADTSHSNPTDVVKSNFAHFAGEGQSVFGYYAANPEYGRDFAHTMTIVAASKTPWPQIYPSSNITKDAKPDRVLVVDVGGSVGHDLKKFFAANPDVPEGSLVLQDMPNVVEQADLKAPLVAQAHDFFQPQPVKGARAYYMHFVLHDWPEPEAVKILQNLGAAMEKGYSKILLHEIVLKPRGTPRLAAAADLTMMFLASAAERTEATWRDLVAKAGLVVTKIWTLPEAVESIIEVELP